MHIQTADLMTISVKHTIKGTGRSIAYGLPAGGSACTGNLRIPQHNVVSQLGIYGGLARIHLHRKPGQFLGRGNLVKHLAINLLGVFGFTGAPKPIGKGATCRQQQHR